MVESDLENYIRSTSPTPSLDDIIALCDFKLDYPRLGALCAQFGICTRPEFKKAFARARKNEAIRDILGMVPTNPRDLITAIADQQDFKIDPSAADPTSWIIPAIGKRGAFLTGDLLEEAKNQNRNLLDNRFTPQNIADEVDLFGRAIRDQLRGDTLANLCDASDFDWEGLIQTCFDTRRVRWEVQAAALQKFVWMVKRKLAGLPVTNHLLPVVYGSQGCGKSRFVEQLLAPLGLMATRADFSRLTDNRESDLFANFAIFLDEMRKCTTAEAGAIKETITRSVFSYRPMGTNLTVERTQNASFIGTSNVLLAQLINDPTGNRRFFQLDFKSSSGRSEWDYANALDWLAVWRSVDHNSDDPSLPYHGEMATLREADRVGSTVEQFADHVMENRGVYRTPTGEAFMPAKPVSKETLFSAYRDYCSALSFRYPLELPGFLAELRRLATTDQAFAFEPKRTGAFAGWRYTGPTSVNVVTLRGDRS